MHEAAYRQLKTAILSNQLSTGVYYTENEFADALNISRTPIRGAIKDLIHDDLLVSVPRKGLKVREFTQSEVEQIFLLRKAIEGEVIGKLLEMVTDEHVFALETLVTKQKHMIEAGDDISFIDLDLEFHQAIIRFANYGLIENMIAKLYNLTRLIGHKAIMKEGRMEEVIDEHREIIEAVRNKDGARSKQLMVQHLENTQRSFRWIHDQSEVI
ncbi:DNA-binding GntR family transcriptional regulator [Melghirimyces profundicolus]|uniref:DNA-binding GntR family transcriptional regulator n=2 Tax=Melghirimyces profundicolus TaxID=1242148 RepID=A0A2T6BD51_9BACL|nr:DNA-binding GntR family transcriptional regulator [Melghirimyces profundicolus]